VRRQIFHTLKLGVIPAVLILTPGCDTPAEGYLVSDQEAYNEAVKNAKPGDIIRLANGTWEDFEILFTGQGEEGNPIRLTAETKGKVILAGQSNLRLAGEYLEVSGLVFKDGYTPTSEVISFRRNSKDLANNSRVSEVVIDNFNNPERYEVDFWVMMYGKNNRFDHNHLVGKLNKGVTMAVRLNNEASQENFHRIDHNYFGPRPILGSNGGETLRIGTSHYSRTDSFTVVENNYFDRCDGELEIISNKSGRNEFRNNTFFESRGTLTMRHGNNNIVENNVFFGNDADHTGGIRGSDEERSGVPSDSTFEANFIYNEDGRDVFTVYDDMSGIDFKDNVLASMDPPDFTDGFRREAVSLSREENGQVNLSFERSALFQINNGGSLQLTGLNISGKDSPDNAGNSVIRTSPYSMLDNYRLEIIDSHFTDIDINHSFNIVSVSKGTFADNILIKDSSFKDVTGSVLKLNKEDDDYGIYNAEYVTIENSQFENVGQELITFYRGGTDESTFGPHLDISASNFVSIGADKRNKSKSSLLLHGVQVTNISGNTFKDSRPFIVNHTVGEPKTKITKNTFRP